MEENSETQMEADVASCTDESMGSHGDLETIIVVEEIKEEDGPPESRTKEMPLTEEKSTKEDSILNASDSEETPPVLAVMPEETPQLSLKIQPPKELQMSLSKDAHVFRTYSRSPVGLPRDSQIPSSKLAQSPNQHSIKEPTDSSSDLSVIQDASIKDQHKILQKSPTKTVQSKDVQPVTDVVDSPSKATAKSIVKSPSKEKGLQKSPAKPELCKSILPSGTLDTPKIDNPSQNMLLNPLLLSALSRQTEIKFIPETIKSVQPEDTAQTVINTPSVGVLSEKSSDSAPEITLETMETHNKGISRELKSLIKSAKDSKIISECTQLTTKTRKSRGTLDISSSNTSTPEPDRPIMRRRNSYNPIITNITERSDKSSLKRSMRSQNPDFVNKVKQFLNSVTGKIAKSEVELISEDEAEEKRVKDSLNDSLSRLPKKKKSNDTEATISVKGSKHLSDPYCWRCHWAVEQEVNDKQHPPMSCTVCPRSFHHKCLNGIDRNKVISEKNWVCPECLIVLNAESSETRSPAMKKISLGSLCDLLKYALGRMMDLNGVEQFMISVDRTTFPDYEKYVVHPMDLLIMKSNIDEGLYGSTEAFLADAQWILHNSIIFNTMQSKLTAAARALVRSCKAEMGEIEACPECYLAAHSRRPTWFTDVCSTPHTLLWAKLKGFPYWPAKCMSVSSTSLVDVRFFGAHDRAWVPARDCYLFSEKDPNNFRTKRQDLLDSMQEAENHIRNISRKYGKFVYPPFKTQFDVTKQTEQLKMMIPTFEGEIKIPIKEKSTPKMGKNKSRSNSKCSKGSSNDGETSDTEDVKSPSTIIVDSAETVSEDFALNKDVSRALSEVADVPKETETCRKRRRSEMEEAVITIMEGPKERKKCLEIDQRVQEIPNETEVINGTPPEEASKNEEEDMEKISEVQIVSSTIPLDNKNVLNDSTTEVKRPPIKMILKTNKCFKTSPPKEKHSPNKTTPLKLRVLRIDKTKLTVKAKHSKTKSHKRKDSKKGSLSTTIAKLVTLKQNNENKTSDVVDKYPENKNETKDNTAKVDETGDDNMIKSKEKRDGDQKENNCKDEAEKVKQPKPKEQEATKENNSAKSKEPPKSKEITGLKIAGGEKLKDSNGKINSPRMRSNNTPKYKETVGNIHSEKNTSSKRNSTASPKTTKERKQVDEENTSLAVIVAEGVKRGSLTGLPTISSVRSLSSPKTVDSGTKTSNKIAENNKDSSVFTPTINDYVRNMNDAVTKLNKLRKNTNKSLVGKVGVCAFARMPSITAANKGANKANDNVEVEIKAEPLEFDDSDRQVEKLHLMKTFSLRPVAPSHVPANIREVKINKITAGPASRKGVTKPDPKNKARKILPQAKKGEEGRSELNSKNSMVYIPIQPPVTQAPIRMTKPVTVNGNSSTIPTSRANMTIVTTNSPGVNAQPSTQVVLPSSQVVLPSTKSSPSVPTTMTIVSVTSNANQAPLQTFPTGPIPTTLHSVHTVPLITSVNGQWTFSLQPIMSVGGLDVTDGDRPAPMLNGVNPADRTKAPPGTMALANGPTPTSFVTVPKPAAAPNTVVAPNTTTSPIVVVSPVQPSVQSASPLTLGNRPAADDTPSTVGEPPRLQHKPLLNPFDVNTPLGNVPVPSTAGPITAKLNQNAIKLTDFFRTILEDTIERIEEPMAEVTAVKLQLEDMRWRHQQEINELKHNHDLVLAEMRATFEKERMRAVNEARRTGQLDLEAAVKLAKSKQWCANCSQEAQFYCCWNTSYCDYGCQRAHWTQHYSICMQSRSQDSDSESHSVNNMQQSSTENVPQPMIAPALSKAPPPRVFTKEQQASPKSIIVSMVDDRIGNPTVKCVGTYKPPAQPTAAPLPIIINKPVSLINNDDVTAKKVVTSGGYLIVGAPNSSPLVTAPRRPQTIQYFS